MSTNPESGQSLGQVKHPQNSEGEQAVEDDQDIALGEREVLRVMGHYAVEYSSQPLDTQNEDIDDVVDISREEDRIC